MDTSLLTNQSQTQDDFFPSWITLPPGEITPGLSIVIPFTVKIEYDHQGSYVVSEELSAVYGIGLTYLTALEDYAVSLAEYYDLIAASEDEPQNQALLSHLQHYLIRK